MKINRKIALLWMSCVMILIIIADLLTKHFTVGVNSDLIPNIIKLFYSENTGAAWSIFSGSQVALIIFSVFAVAFILIYAFFSKSNNKILYISLGLILGGAMGNMFDRITLGFVRDFIKLEFINFPIFNVADIALNVGIILLCVGLLIEGIKENKKSGRKK